MTPQGTEGIATERTASPNASETNPPTNVNVAQHQPHIGPSGDQQAVVRTAPHGRVVNALMAGPVQDALISRLDGEALFALTEAGGVGQAFDSHPMAEHTYHAAVLCQQMEGKLRNPFFYPSPQQLDELRECSAHMTSEQVDSIANAAFKSGYVPPVAVVGAVLSHRTPQEASRWVDKVRLLEPDVRSDFLEAVLGALGSEANPGVRAAFEALKTA